MDHITKANLTSNNLKLLILSSVALKQCKKHEAMTHPVACEVNIQEIDSR